MKRSLSPEACDSPKKLGKIPEDYRLVFFDLETTGLDPKKCEILQIGAKCGEKIFKEYVMPTEEFEPIITKVTGLSVNDGVMYKDKDKRVNAMTKEDAIIKFFVYLSELKGKVILIAHYGHGFDGPILSRCIKEIDMLDDFKEIVSGFSDTLPIFYKKLPGRNVSMNKNYRLPGLAREFLGVTDGLHDALVDTEVLERLTLHPKINVSKEDFIRNLQSIDTVLLKLTAD